MQVNPNSIVSEIKKFYNKIKRRNEYSWVRWSSDRKRFDIDSANAFFVGVLLDQGQPYERAWDGGKHMVQNYFQNKDNWWQSIIDTHHSTVKKICQTGYDGTSYALHFNYNKFPNWLRNAAKKIVDEYDGDVRKIWNVQSSAVNLIYDRFLEFDGMGDALAKMAQFILVREYGVAGGIENRASMSVKPDKHVRRVMFRTGLSKSMKVKDVVKTAEQLNLKSPADFDAAVFLIGRNICSPSSPDCDICTLQNVCRYSNS